MKKAKLFMDTVIEIEVVETDAHTKEDIETKINTAFNAFREVEAACSRFSPDSELMNVCRLPRVPHTVSPFLFEPVKFALELAGTTAGVFDPTIGKVLEDQGFNQHYLTKERVKSQVDTSVTYRDITIDKEGRSLKIEKPMIIDLGAVAKGFAIDLAANELKVFDGFIINAGGDLYAGGLDANGEKWKVGIQHPQEKDKIIDIVDISNQSICTSGSYERRSKNNSDIHHIINPKNQQSPNDWVSVSIIAPFAMMADAFSTATFLLGKKYGKGLLQHLGLQAILITSELDIDRVGGI